MPKRAPGPVALLWGEDAFLLREAALARLGDVRPVELDASDWRGGELQDLATPSLFGETRALLVTDARSLTKEAAAELAAYLTSPAADAHLVICAHVAERGKAPVALTKLVKPVGDVVHVEIKRKDLEPWVVRRADGLGLDLSVPAARALVETIGDRPAELVASLQQIAAAFPGQRITPAVVAQQFRGLGDQKVWDLCDRAFSHDLGGAVRAWRSIEEGGDDPLKVLGGISSRLRDLIRVRSLPERLALTDVKERAGLRFEWQARRYQQQARRFSMAQLLRLHERVAEADRALKSGASGDLVMPALVVAIAGDRG
jgi:DNA polymerase III subunit delta